MKRAAAERSKNVFRGQSAGTRNHRVMPPEPVQAVCVRSRDQRLAKLPRDRSGAPVGVEQAFMEMAKLNRIEAIDFPN